MMASLSGAMRLARVFSFAAVLAATLAVTHVQAQTLPPVADVTIQGGCTQDLNRVCSSIRIRTFRPPGFNFTDVQVFPTVWTEGLLRQGSMTSVASVEPLYTHDPQVSGPQYCSWNGLGQSGCMNAHFFRVDCDVNGHNIALASSLDASTNLLDTVHLTSHHQSFLTYLNACTGRLSDIQS